MSATEAYFVTRTVRALELLAFGPLSAPQVAAALQIHPRTARRMLARLAEEEYVTQLGGPRRRYVLTMRLVAVAGQWLEHAELPHLAAPLVAQLHAATSLTAHLVVPSHDRVRCLVHAADTGIVEPRLRELVPAHCTAGGKALLAGRDRWRAGLLSRPLRSDTHRTITEPSKIEQEAAATRQRGCAIEDGEYQPGFRALAAPVHDPADDTIAAIGITTTGSLDGQAVSGHVERAAAALSGKLAGTPRHSPDGSARASDSGRRHLCIRIVQRRALGPARSVGYRLIRSVSVAILDGLSATSPRTGRRGVRSYS